MVSIEQIENSDTPDAFLLSIDAMVSDWESLTLDEDSAKRFRHGAKPRLADDVLTEFSANDQRLRIYDAGNKFIGLGQIAEGRLQTVRLIGAQS